MTDTDEFGTYIPKTTATSSTEWNIGCKCGCENEDECHGKSGCDGDEEENP